MKTLSELKKLQVGQVLKLIDSFHKPHKFLNQERKIAKMQTNALMFENKSWLYFPKAPQFKGTEKGFIIRDEVPIYDDQQRPERDEQGKTKMREVDFLEYEVIS